MFCDFRSFYIFVPYSVDYQIEIVDCVFETLLVSDVGSVKVFKGQNNLFDECNFLFALLLNQKF